jgi:SAM-dependent methyltransferase
MRDIVNTRQAEAWNGYEGRHWAQNRGRYDAMNGGMNAPLWEAAAITEVDRILDIGCGTGQTTRLAGRQAFRGSALGVDLSAAMLYRARTVAVNERIDNVTFEQGDAQTHPFPEMSFDVAISRCGVMFFADPVAAFANIRRALRPGGRLAFVCLRDPGPGDDLARALAPLWALVGEHAPPTAAPPVGAPAGAGPGPTSLADPGRIDEVLRGAGFTQVSAVPIIVSMVLGRDAEDAADFVFAMGPMRFNLSGAAPAAVAAARAAVVTGLRDCGDLDAVRLRTGLWLVRATRPVATAHERDGETRS